MEEEFLCMKYGVRCTTDCKHVFQQTSYTVHHTPYKRIVTFYYNAGFSHKKNRL